MDNHCFNQCWKTRDFSRGRGRARGSNLKRLFKLKLVFFDRKKFCSFWFLGMKKSKICLKKITRPQPPARPRGRSEILTGAGGRGGQNSKFLRVRAGAGARSARPGARGPSRAMVFQHWLQYCWSYVQLFVISKNKLYFQLLGLLIGNQRDRLIKIYGIKTKNSCFRYVKNCKILTTSV